MTENLLLKLEEKMMSILSEVENLRKEIGQVRNENAHLKAEKELHAKKLHELLSLFDSMTPADHATPITVTLTTVNGGLKEIGN